MVYFMQWVALVSIVTCMAGFLLIALFNVYFRFRYKGRGVVDLVDGKVRLRGIKLVDVVVYVGPNEMVVFEDVTSAKKRSK